MMKTVSMISHNRSMLLNLMERILEKLMTTKITAAWLAERQLLAGDIESNPGPKPTLKTLYTHSRNPHTHYNIH